MKIFKKKLKLSKTVFSIVFLLFLFYFFNILYSEQELFTNIKHNSNLTLKNNKWIILQEIVGTSDKIKKNLLFSKDYEIQVISNSRHGFNLNVDHLNHENSSKATKKNFAYLNAIKNGARFIYDSSNELSLSADLDNFFKPDDLTEDYGLMLDESSSTKMFNIYAHFGQPDVFPRGFVKFKNYNKSAFRYISGRRKKSIIQHALIGDYPDLSKNSLKTLKSKMIFDQTSSSIQLPAEVYAPFNSINTFYHYKSFWALYLPRTVKYSQSDIIRSYWSQKLLWLIDGTVCFYGVNSYREPTLAFEKIKEEEDYPVLENLIKFLFKWKCNRNRFYLCIIDLSEQMARNKFWDYKEVYYIKNWLNKLTNIGYKEPSLVNLNKTKEKIIFNEFDDKLYDFYQVKYTPKSQHNQEESSSVSVRGSALEFNKLFENYRHLESFCQFSNASLRFKLENFNRVDRPKSISLVVSFNWQPISQNIELISAIYGRHFRHIVFCGPNMMAKIENLKKLESTTFIEMNTIKGEFHYYCMTKAIELDLNTNGYLLMSDDVLLKYWKLDQFDVSKIWFPFQLDCSKSYELNPNYVHYQEWGWWKSEIGLKALLKVWSYFGEIQKQNVSTNIKIVENFLEFIKLNSGPGANVTKVCGNFVSDIFYLPRLHFKPFHFISEIFRKFKVYVEIAVSTILAGLEHYEKIELLPGTYKCCGKFGLHLYSEMGVFGHAAKISKYNASEEGKKFCELFIQDTLNLK